MAENTDDDSDLINIDYIKGTLFRTISPSGLMGSITPQGKIQVAFFSERQAIPQRVVHRLDDNGELGDVVDVISRDSVVRELDIAVTFDIDTARQLIGFLRNVIGESENDNDSGRNE